MANDDLFAIGSLGSQLPAVLAQRVTYLSRMDAAPMANYVIGQLMTLIDLSSAENLIVSLKRLGGIASLASHTLLSTQGMRADKEQMNPSALVSYIEQWGKQRQFKDVSPEDYQLVAAVMVGFEADPTAWTLHVPSNAASDIHLACASLYEKLLITTPANQLVVPVPGNGPVELAKMPQYASTTAAVLKEKAVILRLGLTRMVDHVHALLMSRDIWYEFMTPRQTMQSVSGNIDRGRSLQLLKIYIDSLLSIPLLFNFEGFMWATSLFAKWVDVPLALPARTEADLKLIRNNDHLDIGSDVRKMLDSLSANASMQNAGPVTIIPQEIISTEEIKNAISAAYESLDLTGSVGVTSDLRQLRKGLFHPLIAGVNVGGLPVQRSLMEYIRKPKELLAEVDVAVVALLETFNQSVDAALTTRLHTMSLTPPLDLLLSHATSYQATGAYTPGVTEEAINLDAGMPAHSTAVAKLVKHKFRETTFLASYFITQAAELRAPGLIDELRRQLYIQWFGEGRACPLPASMGYKDVSYSTKELYSSPNQLVRFLESTWHTKLDFALLDLRYPEDRRRWATHMSGFCLLFVDPSLLDVDFVIDHKPETVADIGQATLVEGYHLPFGLTYAQLNSLQATAGVARESGAIDADPLAKEGDEAGAGGANAPLFIRIAPGCFIRILHVLPVTNPKLARTVQGFRGHGFLHFQGSPKGAVDGGLIYVDRWIAGSSMWHFALAPIPQLPLIPAMVFTRSNFFYINDEAMLEMYAPWHPTIQPPRSSMRVAVTTKPWPYIWFVQHARWVVGGNYGVVAGFEGPQTDDEELLKEAARKQDAAVEKERKELDLNSQLGKDGAQLVEATGHVEHLIKSEAPGTSISEL